MWLVIQKGGYLMYPIALCSIFALGIFLERLWTYTKVRKEFRELAHQIEPLVAKDHREDAITVCHKSNSPLAQVFLAALRAAGRSAVGASSGAPADPGDVSVPDIGPRR